jgi:hypothetical protein
MNKTGASKIRLQSQKHNGGAHLYGSSRADRIFEVIQRHPDAMKTVNPFELPGMNRQERRKLEKKLKDKR